MFRYNRQYAGLKGKAKFPYNTKHLQEDLEDMNGGEPFYCAVLLAQTWSCMGESTERFPGAIITNVNIWCARKKNPEAFWKQLASRDRVVVWPGTDYMNSCCNHIYCDYIVFLDMMSKHSIKSPSFMVSLAVHATDTSVISFLTHWIFFFFNTA